MKYVSYLFIVVFCGSCATYYQLNQNFNRSFELGNLPEAEKLLNDNKGAENSKDKFLYFLNKGTVAALLDKPSESNAYFEKAFLFGEDYKVNYVNEIGSFLTNPSLTEYRGEDHEHLILLYYKALNYLKLGDNQSALVECRRLNNRLQKLSDKYRNDNRYKKDAFIHNLMGIIYDADRDYNNAFIAYRNAYKIYTNEYNDFFNIQPPEQLEEDLLRTAYLNGFDTELERYERLFRKKYRPSKKEGGDLVFFWNNGLGPVKSEWSINFSVLAGQGGVVTFADEQYGWDFPFLIDDDDERGDLTDLKFFRVAFPKYSQRSPLFDQASLIVNGKNYKLQLAEDMNAISVKTLQERMHIEMGKSLLRAALKKVAEEQLRDENEGLGTALGFFNALTEKADTRNWQTIPHSIYYSRVELPEGKQNVTLKAKSVIGARFNQDHEFVFDIRRGQTVFHSFRSLEIAPQNYVPREERRENRLRTGDERSSGEGIQPVQLRLNNGGG